MFMVPLISTALGDASVALDRISKFLLAEELEADYPIDSSSKFAVRLHGDFTWEASESSTTTNAQTQSAPAVKKVDLPEKSRGRVKTEQSKESDRPSSSSDLEEDGLLPFQLNDIRIDIPKGKFVAIVGRVGSGKSSLLQAMAGEMRKVRGEVVFGGSVAYVAQNPWIQVRIFTFHSCVGCELKSILARILLYERILYSVKKTMNPYFETLSMLARCRQTWTCCRTVRRRRSVNKV